MATLIVGVTATLVGMEAMPPVRVSVVPVVTAGVVVPPLLLKVRPAKVVAPVNCNTEPPLRVTLLPEAICCALVDTVICALLSVRPAVLKAMTALVAPTAEAAPLRVTLARLTTVPPE